MRASVALACSLAALAARAGGPPPADPQHTLAIASVEARGGASPEQAAAMTDALVAQLASDGQLRLVERQQLARVMREQALAQAGALSDEVQVKLAQLVGARFIAVGAVQGSGGGLLLSLRAVDSSSAQVVWAETLKIGGADQVEAGARRLARKLEEKLAGTPKGAGAPATEAVGDFDAAQVRDGARAAARALAARFPRVAGKVVDSLPDGTTTCAFGKAQPFVGELFVVTGRDEVTETDRRKGLFMLQQLSESACSGKVKREVPAEISAGDALESRPLPLALQPLEAGEGAGGELAKLFEGELRAALSQQTELRLTDSPQLTAQARLSGPRGQRLIQVRVTDRKGLLVQQLELPGAY